MDRVEVRPRDGEEEEEVGRGGAREAGEGGVGSPGEEAGGEGVLVWGEVSAMGFAAVERRRGGRGERREEGEK